LSAGYDRVTRFGWLFSGLAGDYRTTMTASITKICIACREPHVFFLPMGKAAEPTRRYEYACPKTRARVPFAASTADRWTPAEIKPRGCVIVREVMARKE
jgi:hypothetical protein